MGKAAFRVKSRGRPAGCGPRRKSPSNQRSEDSAAAG